MRPHAFTPFLAIDDSYDVPAPVLGGLTAGGYEKVFAQEQDTYGVSVGGLIPEESAILFRVS